MTDHLTNDKKSSKKDSVIGIVVVLLLLFGVFALLGGNTTDKTPVGVTPETPESNNSSELKNKIEETDYEHVEGYKEYKDSLHRYSEESVSHMADLNFNNVDGHPLYMRLISLKKDGELIKELVFSVGYLDDENKWHEVKKYDSKKTSALFLEASHPELKKLKGGCFTKTDDPNYKACCGGGYIVVEKPFGIREKESRYIHCTIEENNCIKNGYGCRGFRTNIDSSPGPLISDILDHKPL